MNDIDKLLPDPDDSDWVDDMAFTFVEQGLGRIHFAENWDRTTDKEGTVRNWLVRIGENPEGADKIVQRINELRQSKMRWRYP